ncbi:uncharacterized protein LOC128682311 isoform X2 [Plodia interpunctella]|uniref:uncharacterized protein LOC128682311 isoform X2 n=1 Tax=Plodia interpunctella TaxID=58824 RepID=UPI0023688AF1|nr:uncharacterized protein LOC128682311 isoform X2 [Plodia interpunctella]
MYLIFITVALLLLIQSTFSVDIASDKDTLKDSLTQVDKFLDKVGQSIQLERTYLRTLGRKKISTNAQTQPSTTSNEFDNLFPDRKIFKDASITRRKLDNSEQTHSQAKDLPEYDGIRHPNFMRAVAGFNNKISPGSTQKLSNAVIGLKNLMKPDISIKSERNVDKATNDILTQVKDKLTENSANKNKTKPADKIKNNSVKDITEQKEDSHLVKDNTENKEEHFEIFDKLDFPTHGQFPISVTLKITETTPEAMNQDFIPDAHDEGDFLKTSTPSTQLDHILLNPLDFGYTSTHKPLPTYGDLTDSPLKLDEYLTTTPEPDDFAKDFKKQMDHFNVGVFSVAMMKMFEFAMVKEPKVLRRLAWGFARFMESYHFRGRFTDFGQPTEHALRTTSEQIGNIHPDELKSYGINLHNSMIHRRDMFSKDINSIIDYIDTLYLKEESDEVIESVESLHIYNNKSRTPYTELERFVNSIIAPFERLKETPRGEILKESLNRGLRNHFFPDREYDPEHRRSNIKKTNNTRRKTNKKSAINKFTRKEKRRMDFEVGQDWFSTQNPYSLPPIQEQAFTLLNKNDAYVKPFVEQNLANNKDKYNQIQEQGFTSLNNNDRFGFKPIIEQVVSAMPNKGPFVQKALKDQTYTLNNQDRFRINLIQRQGTTPNNIMTVNKAILNRNTGAISPLVHLAVTKSWSRQNINENKRLISINKKDTSLNPDRSLKMSSGKKHHKKHRHSHKRMKHKLSKILRIIRQYKPNYKKSKHKKHHHKHSRHKPRLRARGDEEILVSNQGTQHKTHRNQDKRARGKKLAKIYGVTRDYNENNVNNRRNLEEDNTETTVHILRQLSDETDEEIPLKINLYKALAITTVHEDDIKDFQEAVPRANDDIGNNRKDNNGGEDHEMFLKNKLYDYFSRNIPVS